MNQELRIECKHKVHSFQKEMVEIEGVGVV